LAFDFNRKKVGAAHASGGAENCSRKALPLRRADTTTEVTETDCSHQTRPERLRPCPSSIRHLAQKAQGFDSLRSAKAFSVRAIEERARARLCVDRAIARAISTNALCFQHTTPTDLCSPQTATQRLQFTTQHGSEVTRRSGYRTVLAGVFVRNERSAQ